MAQKLLTSVCFFIVQVFIAPLVSNKIIRLIDECIAYNLAHLHWATLMRIQSTRTLQSRGTMQSDCNMLTPGLLNMMQCVPSPNGAFQYVLHMTC